MEPHGMGSHGIVGSSDGTEERENNSINLCSEGVSLNLIQPSLEEDVSTEILLANKKLGSNVWKEFELIMLDDGTSKAICKHCKKDFVAGNRAATSHLKYHTGGLYMRAIQVIIVNRSWRSILKTRLLLELAIVLLIFWLGGGLMAQNIQAFLISRMARDILSVPLSTVASESIFSSSKRILDDYRWNLLPETIEAIMCSHDWLKGRIPVDPRVVEDNISTYESSVPTPNQEDQTDGD